MKRVDSNEEVITNELQTDTKAQRENTAPNASPPAFVLSRRRKIYQAAVAVAERKDHRKIRKEAMVSVQRDYVCVCVCVRESKMQARKSSQ
jgi:hypothetical protein